MSKKDYGTKLAESLRQARQLDTEQPSTAETTRPAAPATPPPVKPQAPAPATAAPKSTPVGRSVTRSTSVSVPLAVWPD